jgi:hypothetical protein
MWKNHNQWSKPSLRLRPCGHIPPQSKIIDKSRSIKKLKNGFRIKKWLFGDFLSVPVFSCHKQKKKLQISWQILSYNKTAYEMTAGWPISYGHLRSSCGHLSESCGCLKGMNPRGYGHPSSYRHLLVINAGIGLHATVSIMFQWICIQFHVSWKHSSWDRLLKPSTVGPTWYFTFAHCPIMVFT